MDLRQSINNLEELRKKCKNAFLLVVASVTGFMISLFIIPLCPMLFILSFGLVGLTVWFSTRLKDANRTFQNAYKNVLVKGMLQELFGDVICDWNNGYSEQVVERIGLVKHGNRFSSEDYIKGVYEGIPFEQSDVVIKHVVRSGKQTHTYTYFEGRMFTFDLAKSDIQSMVVFSRTFMYQGDCGGFRHEKVSMESQEFNKCFHVKATNPHDAFYILTPQMMECIEKLRQRYHNVAIRFVGQKMHVAINLPGNAFNGDYKKPIVYVDEKKKIEQDCDVIVSIIRTLRMEAQKREQA